MFIRSRHVEGRNKRYTYYSIVEAFRENRQHGRLLGLKLWYQVLDFRWYLAGQFVALGRQRPPGDFNRLNQFFGRHNSRPVWKAYSIGTSRHQSEPVNQCGTRLGLP
jgi:hypothetical protein